MTTNKLSSIFLIIFCLCTSSIQVLAQGGNFSEPLPRFQGDEQLWVDQIYNKMNLEEKIGQLFMVAAYSGTSKINQSQIETLIQNHKIGGLIFMQGTASAQAIMTNSYQRMTKIPLLIGMDAEWGLGMRLTGIKDLPRQMSIGASDDSTLAYTMGSVIAAQCKRLGVHMNFGPVVDVNNNPNNPVINFRSYGENKYKVANFGIEYMKGLQQNGVLACAKHFPGHGDTDVDSHKDLPEIKKSMAEIRETELYPFDQLFRSGVASVMIAHLQIPAIDNQKNTPTTLSKKAVTNLLKRDMGYDGLIITDALNMKGVTKYYSPGEVDLKAFLAGNDVLLFSEDVPTGIRKIKQAYLNGRIKEARLRESVEKILRAKYKAGLQNFKTISLDDIDADINKSVSLLRKQISEKSATLINDPFNVLSTIKNRTGKKIAYIAVGTSQEKPVIAEMKKAGISVHYAPTHSRGISSFGSKFKHYDAVIVGIHNMNWYHSKKYGLDAGEIKVIQALARNRNTLNVVMGNPYALRLFDNEGGHLIAYDEYDESSSTISEILLGYTSAQGMIPVTINQKFKQGTGIRNLGRNSSYPRYERSKAKSERFVAKRFDSEPKSRNQTIIRCCASPQEVGSNEAYLKKVDNIIQEGLNSGAYPGCRVLMAKDGKVFYDKSFGYLTYNKKQPVTSETLFDVASITKMAATTLAVMKLYEEGRIQLDAPLSRYISRAKYTNKANVKVRDLLLHQGRLKAWIPFYKETNDENSYPKKSIYQPKPSRNYPVQVASGLFMKRSWIDTMWARIYDSPLRSSYGYKYSDLDFIFLQQIVEKVSGMKLDQYVEQHFYKPLALQRTLFNPAQNAYRGPIAPSEYDSYWRHKIVKGYVHDMGAAMFGGVSGHAGLFTTANDLSVIMQMLLNGGVYAGKQYLQSSTIAEFTRKYSGVSRRGMGFDKPQPNRNKAQPTSTNCSLATFGHTGFTGTCAWADPRHNIQFIFLSNRTYPSMDNRKLIRMDVRERAQQQLYNSFGIK